MEFRVLGPLEVEGEGRLLKLGGVRQRSLLAALLLRANEVVSRDRLMDDLWGASPPETAATALQVYVSQLRKALGRDLILTQPPGYLIRVSDGELDLHRFERLVATARVEEPAQAARLLREGLALWRGAPLAELGDSFARATSSSSDASLDTCTRSRTRPFTWMTSSKVARSSHAGSATGHGSAQRRSRPRRCHSSSATCGA